MVTSFKNFNKLVPALKDKVNGKVIIGHKGKTHHDLLPANDRMKNYDLGFYHHGTKKYISRYHDKIRLHSTDLMTPMQRFRRFNTEETDKIKLAREIANRTKPRFIDIPRERAWQKKLRKKQEKNDIFGKERQRLIATWNK